jgi:hypothetical protein
VIRSTRFTPFVAAAVAIAALVVVSAAFAKPATPHSRYTSSLTASPNPVHAGEVLTVSGCGYAPDRSVKVTFTGGVWGAMPDPVEGCFSIDGIPALSGDTLPPGTYEVSAYQYNGKRWIETGETTVTVVE